MHLALDDPPARLVVEIIGQRFEGAGNQRPIVQVAGGQRIGAGQQPGQHAVGGTILGRRFIVDATAAEGIEHDPGPRAQLPPEPPVEEDRDAQVMAGAVVVRDMSGHRPAQTLAYPFDFLQPVIRQGENDGVELTLDEVARAAGGDDVAAVARARHPHDRRVELDSGAHQARSQTPGQHLHATFDRVLRAVDRFGLQEVAKPDEPAGQMRLGRHVAVSGDLQIPPRDRVRHVLQNVRARSRRPRMPVVIQAESAVPAREWQHRDRLAAKVFDCAERAGAKMRAELALVGEKPPVHDDGAAVGRHGVEPQLRDQLAERIVADGIVGVALRDPGFVGDWRGIEPTSLDLAAHSLTGLEQRQSTRGAERPFQQPCCHQSAWPAPDNRDSCHISPALVPTQEPRGTGHRSHPGVSIEGQ